MVFPRRYIDEMLKCSTSLQLLQEYVNHYIDQVPSLKLSLTCINENVPCSVQQLIKSLETLDSCCSVEFILLCMIWYIRCYNPTSSLRYQIFLGRSSESDEMISILISFQSKVWGSKGANF
ncbi:hypothetical protein PVL29_001137 [Vitis rotundifolia]|uniref:Uncharacterized protein n=1 Tax=Vitis rotundifolia TaxID=103349 RepID=A0AA39ANZ3_VITRO|nr:hypothetical protein PVL29_001137 [Vitis rotundifolia]